MPLAAYNRRRQPKKFIVPLCERLGQTMTHLHKLLNFLGCALAHAFGAIDAGAFDDGITEAAPDALDANERVKNSAPTREVGVEDSDDVIKVVLVFYK